MHVLTLIAAEAYPLSEAAVARVAAVLREPAIAWLAPARAADLFCAEAPAMDQVTRALAGAPVDAIAQLAAGRRKRLLIADMDSTIVTTETLDELAAHAGLKAEISAVTARSMNGEIDFREALVLRVGLLRGLAVSALAATWAETRISPGAAELVATMRADGAVCALVSGGFSYFTSRVAAQLGFDQQRANVLLDDGVALTGGLGEPILDRDGKCAVLRELAQAHGLDLEQTMAVGDGANDLAMLRAAGMGVAYRAKPIVAREARASLEFSDLRALLYIQGYQGQGSALDPLRACP